METDMLSVGEYASGRLANLELRDGGLDNTGSGLKASGLTFEIKKRILNPVCRMVLGSVSLGILQRTERLLLDVSQGTGDAPLRGQ